jgi:hypothetical protein
MSNPTIPLREQLESARAKLSSVTARFEALPLNKQICFGDLPQKVTSLLEARIIEQADKRLPAAAVKPAAPSPVPKPATAANLQSIGSTVAALAKK